MFRINCKFFKCSSTKERLPTSYCHSMHPSLEPSLQCIWTAVRHVNVVQKSLLFWSEFYWIVLYNICASPWIKGHHSGGLGMLYFILWKPRSPAAAAATLAYVEQQQLHGPAARWRQNARVYSAIFFFFKRPRRWVSGQKKGQTYWYASVFIRKLVLFLHA